jgi:hypothetical protein
VACGFAAPKNGTFLDEAGSLRMARSIRGATWVCGFKSRRPDLISEFLRFDLVHGDSEVQTTRLNRGVRVSDSRNSCSDRC